MTKLIITRATMAVSLQDQGRSGYLAEGISEAGPMDWARHSMVNRMLEKPFGATALEIGPAGMACTIDQGELQVSVAAPKFSVLVDHKKLPTPARFTLQAGQQLDIQPNSGAMWAYLGFQGKLDTPKLLGSHSENSVSGMHALKINMGARLSLQLNANIFPGCQAYFDPYLSQTHREIEIIPSSQTADFSPEIQAKITEFTWMISRHFDRMAYRLEGEKLPCGQGHDILSDGITMGAIQVPGDGQPFVLMADHQTTGGYPKIACICKVDLPRFAQLAPGSGVRFAWQSSQRALQRWQDINQQIVDLVPLRGCSFTF